MANPTTNLDITLPVPGAESSRGTWGEVINDAIQSLDTVIVANTGGTFTGAVTIPSPVLNTGVSGSAIKDEDNMSSDSATHIATQQSIKAYVDSQTHEAGDITSVVAGSGLTGTSLTGPIPTLNVIGGTGITANADDIAIDATVATLAGTQTFTGTKTLTAPLLGTPTSGVMTNVTGTASGLTAGNVTTNANLTGDVTSSGSNVTSIASDVIINADVKSDAAIAMSKTALVGGTGLTLSTNTLNVDAAQTQITSVGTIATGTWEGTTVAVDQGGTGVTSKTGTGNVVLSTSPTLVTPLLGTPTSGVLTNCTGTAAGLTAGTATTVTNVTVAAESTISSQTIVHQYNVNSEVVLSCASHGLAENQPITITVSGTPPEGVVTGTIYYVRPGVVTNYGSGLSGVANNFRLATTSGGTNLPVTTSGWLGSVSHVFHKVRYPLFTGLVTGDLSPKTGTGLTLTAEGRLTSTTFAGALTGDVTGDLTGDVTGTASGNDTAGTGVAMAIALG